MRVEVRQRRVNARVKRMEPRRIGMMRRGDSLGDRPGDGIRVVVVFLVVVVVVVREGFARRGVKMLQLRGLVVVRLEIAEVC